MDPVVLRSLHVCAIAESNNDSYNCRSSPVSFRFFVVIKPTTNCADYAPLKEMFLQKLAGRAK